MERKGWECFKRDLCARLPYGVKVSILGSDPMELKSCINSSVGWFAMIDGAPTDFGLDEIKPYLRPWSSMTRKERDMYGLLFKIATEYDLPEGQYFYVGDLVDWLNSRHIDHHNLIERGLAIEAPANMYELEEPRNPLEQAAL